jgi:hypothetical protein
MKNKVLCFLVTILFSYQLVCGQTKQDNSIKLQDIQVTNAPAFSLLDVSPSSIESPCSTKAFSASIVDAVAESSGIPQNYAMEFTPFWFISHLHYTNFKYFGISPAGMNLPFSQARLFAVSFALINKDSVTNIGKLGNHNASLGFRTTLLHINSPAVNRRILELNREWDQALAGGADSLSVTLPTQHELDSMAASLHYADTIRQYLLAKPLFSMDAAAASNLSFVNNSFSSQRLSRSGVWLNSNLSINLCKRNPGKDYLTLSVMTRYIYARDSLDSKGRFLPSQIFDLGFKTEFQLGNILLDYEYVYRQNKVAGKRADTYKSVGLIHYRIRDGLCITGAVGQNFSTINNLIATLGLNLGISNGKEKIE